jgi:probable phosphoglycerate mutase
VVAVWSNAVVLSLIRHGRTAANAAGLLQGRLDPDLDDVGRWQVEQLPDAVGKVDRVVSSPLARARQTAAVLAAPVDVDDRFIEIDYGVFDGLSLAEVGPVNLAKWRDDVNFAPEGGESLSELFQRVGPAIEDLREDATGRHVVVVSHVLPIKAAVAWALGIDVGTAWRLHLDQASISRIVFTDAGPVLRSYNDVAHLSGGPPGSGPRVL